MSKISKIAKQIETELGQSPIADQQKGTQEKLAELLTDFSEADREELIERLKENRVKYSDELRKNLFNVGVYIREVALKPIQPKDKPHKRIIAKAKKVGEYSEEVKGNLKEIFSKVKKIHLPKPHLDLSKLSNYGKKAKDSIIGISNDISESLKKIVSQKHKPKTSESEIFEEMFDPNLEADKAIATGRFVYFKKTKGPVLSESELQEIDKVKEILQAQGYRMDVLNFDASGILIIADITAGVQPREEEIEEAEVIEEINHDLTPEDKGTLNAAFQNQSESQIDAVIKSGKLSDKTKRILKKIGKLLAVLGVSAGISYGVYALVKNYQIKKEEKEWNQKIKEKKDIESEKKTITLPIKKQVEKYSPPEVKLEISDISSKINKQNLVGVSYENVVETINTIANPLVKKELISYLKQGDIVGAQTLFAMKPNSSYPSNIADGKIDSRTLSRFADSLYGLEGESLLQNKKIPDDLKQIYKKFLSGEYNNNDKNYLIVSKTDIQIYTFSKDHKLLHHQSVLVGKEKGDAEYVPYPYYRYSDGSIKMHGKTVHPTTPPGMYKIGKTSNTNTIYDAGGPAYTIELTPIDATTQQRQERHDYRSFILAIHGNTKATSDNPNAGEERLLALQSPNVADHYQTHGCISTSPPGFGIVYDNIGSIVYITADQ